MSFPAMLLYLIDDDTTLLDDDVSYILSNYTSLGGGSSI